MKRLFTILLLISLKSLGQLSTQSNTDGSITITPKGVQGKSNPITDTSNVAFGPSALRSLTTGKFNTATGNTSLFSNTRGNANTANGYMALWKNISGLQNTANGYLALYNNTTGINNTANGGKALYTNTIGLYNTANGTETLFSNTTGNNNTANGFQSLYTNTTGANNTANGYGSLYNNTEGYQNTANGVGSLLNNTMGFLNTANGNNAGAFNTTGNSNTFVGSDADSAGPNFVNATSIGAGAIVNSSDKVRIGNGNVTVIEGAVAWSNISDRRLKENIIYTSGLGLDFINKLKTVSYNFISDKTHVRYDGFIAQDIEAVMKELKVDFSGLKKSEDGMYSLAYSDFVMPLVNAAKELKAQNESLVRKVEDLKKQLSKVDILQKRLDAIEASLNAAPTGK